MDTLAQLIETLQMINGFGSWHFLIFWGLLLLFAFGVTNAVMRLTVNRAAGLYNLAVIFAAAFGIYFSAAVLTPDNAEFTRPPLDVLVFGLAVATVMLASYSWEAFSPINIIRTGVLLLCVVALVNLVAFQIILDRQDFSISTSFGGSVGIAVGMFVLGVVAIFLVRAANTRRNINEDYIDHRFVNEIREIVDRQINERYEHINRDERPIQQHGPAVNLDLDSTQTFLSAIVKARTAQVYHSPNGTPILDGAYKQQRELVLDSRTKDNKWVKVRGKAYWVKVEDLTVEGDISKLSNTLPV